MTPFTRIINFTWQNPPPFSICQMLTYHYLHVGLFEEVRWACYQSNWTIPRLRTEIGSNCVQCKICSIFESLLSTSQLSLSSRQLESKTLPTPSLYIYFSTPRIIHPTRFDTSPNTIAAQIGHVPTTHMLQPYIESKSQVLSEVWVHSKRNYSLITSLISNDTHQP